MINSNFFNDYGESQQHVEQFALRWPPARVDDAGSKWDLVDVPGSIISVPGFVEAEVKWNRKGAETGNVPIEYRGNRGQDSGILTTESKIYVFLEHDGDLVVPTASLREFFEMENDWKRKLSYQPYRFFTKSNEGAEILVVNRWVIEKLAGAKFYHFSA